MGFCIQIEKSTFVKDKEACWAAVHGVAKNKTRLSDWRTARRKMNMDWYLLRWVYLFKEIIPECFYLFLLWFLIFQTYECFQNLWLLEDFSQAWFLGAVRGHSRPWTVVWANVSPPWDSDLVWTKWKQFSHFTSLFHIACAWKVLILIQ